MSKNQCPKCGGDQFTDNGGVDHHHGHSGAHIAMRNMMGHGNPWLFALGASVTALRLLNPKKLTCAGCGHVFKA